MRRLAIGFGIFIVVVVAGILIFVTTFDVNRYHGTIQAELEKRLGRPVTLGDMHLGAFPPRFRVQDPSIAEDPHFGGGAAFVKAQQLDVSVKLMPLLHKQVEVDSITLQRPTVNLIKNQSGVWNFASVGQSSESPQPASVPSPRAPGSAGQPAQPPQAASNKQFSLGQLTINDGQISVLDQQKSKTPSLYDHIDVTLKNFSPDKPFSIDAAVHMAGSGSEARLQGEGGPIVQGEPATTPFRGSVTLKQVGISDLSKFFNAPAMSGSDGSLTGETKINSQNGKLTAHGDTNIQNAKVHGTELGYPIAAQYDLTDDLALDVLTIRNFMLKLGPTPLQISGTVPLQISGTVNAKSAPALLDLNVKANNISIAEAAKLGAASGMALSQGTNATGNVNANIQIRGESAKPALNGTVTASNIQVSGKDIPQPIQIPSATFNLTPTQIQSNTFNVTSGGSTLDTQFTLRNYQAPAPVVDATVRAPNAQLPAVLAMAKAYGVTSLDKVNGAGTMNLNLHAAGPLKSVSTAEIMRTLNGTVKVDFNNVKYSGADINHELASIAGFLNSNPASTPAQGYTNILKMTGDIAVKNGIAETNNLQAKLDLGNVGAAGTASLIDNTLNMRVTMVLSQASSQKAGGNSIGGFMQTALANNKGELVVPALVTGTFSNPRFAPDVQQIAQMKVKGLVPNFDNPASVTGALQNLLGGAKNPQAAPSQGQQQQPQQNPVDQLMGIFGKKKKPDQPSQPPK
jgi:AsmA protein